MAESQVMLSLPSPSWRGIRVGGEPPKVRSGHTSIPLGDRSAWAFSPLCVSADVPSVVRSIGLAPGPWAHGLFWLPPQQSWCSAGAGRVCTTTT
jgi:hypothetical protein